MSVVEKEDWKGVMGLVTNAKQVVSSVQDVARKLADYAKFRSKKNLLDAGINEEQAATIASSASEPVMKNIAPCAVPEELYVPGTVYYLKRNLAAHDKVSGKTNEFFMLWKRHPGEHFQRIVLARNLISDHRCISHYYALRDVLKGLPGPKDDSLFR